VQFEELSSTHKLATQGIWSSNCGSEITATRDGQSLRIGHFNGCAADAEAACALHNNFDRIYRWADGSDDVVVLPEDMPWCRAPHELSLSELVMVAEKATDGEWFCDADAYVYAEIDGQELQIGSFQGSYDDAHAACALRNAAKALIAAVVARHAVEAMPSPRTLASLWR
jgi:hypothetical protein